MILTVLPILWYLQEEDTSDVLIITWSYDLNYVILNHIQH